jgi:septum formation protein
MIVLASRSPRRRRLLDQIGVPYEVVHVDVPEIRGPGETPEEFVCRVAQDKARAGVVVSGDGSPVLAADTTVVVDDEILGKPDSGEAAIRMLNQLSGRSHTVLSAVALAWGRSLTCRLSRSEVSFRTLGPSEIEAYVASGEPADKAGAYAIQGGAARFISHIAGSYSGIMGLPLFETAELLGDAGIPGP